MKHQKKYRVHLRIYFAIASIVTLCAVCLLSCGAVVLGTVFLYHGEMTIPVVIALCLLVCTLTMVIGGIALYHETAHFVEPIEEVNHAVNQIAKGDFEVRVPRRQQHRKDAAYVHELDELKANVNRMGAELAGMDYMRKDFVSNVSHEIKTPVSAMMGFAEILLEDDTLSEEQKEHLILIYDEAARVSRLCENMLHVKQELAGIMNADLGITRTGDKLKQGIESVDYYLSVSDKIIFDSEISPYQGYSLEGMLMLAKAILICADMRKETRGAHIREDYPESSSDYQCSTVISYDDGNYTTTFIKED